MNREFIYRSLADQHGAKQVALARVAEECSELAKEAMKALRFGIENRYPASDPTNAEKMAAEYRDIEQALLDVGVLSVDETSLRTRVRERYISRRKLEELNKRRMEDWNKRDLEELDRLLNVEADELLA